MTGFSTLLRCALGALALAALIAPVPVAAQAPAKVTIVVFGFPSLGAFMPPVIKAQKLDDASTALISNSSSARRMPTPRSSIPASSRSAAARRC